MKQDKFIRQRGLVYQSQMEQKSIAFLVNGSYNPILPTALLNCGLLNLGRHGTIYIDTDVIAEEKHVYTDVLINKEDIGKNIAEVYKENIKAYNENLNIVCSKPTHSVNMTIVLYEDEPELNHLAVSNYLFCTLTIDGFYLGKTPYIYKGESAGQLTSVLSHLAGAVLVQEILKSLNLIRPLTIVESALQARFVIKSPSVDHVFQNGEEKPPFTMVLGDEEVNLTPIEQTKKGEGVFTVDVNSQADLLEPFRLISTEEDNRRNEIHEYLFSFFGYCEAKEGYITCLENAQTISIEKLTATLFGVGALGSWSAFILALSKIEDLQLNLVDMDTTVEPSNLNRQLFTKESLGRAKVFEAEKRLHQIKEDIKVHVYPLEITTGILDLFDVDMEVNYTHPDLMADDEETDRELLQSLMLINDLKNSALVSCLDSLGARWIVQEMQKKTHQVMVNAGTQGFYCQADLIRWDKTESYDENLSERYGEHIKDEVEQHSCTGGELPIPSIVTSTVIGASLEVLFLLTSHIKPQPKSFIRYSDKNCSLKAISYVTPF